MGKNEILTFRGVKENPFGPTEKKNTKKLVADYIELGREVKDRLRADQPEASVVLNTKGGVARILIFSDFHFGAEASDPKVYNEALAELNKPNTFCILDADIIEGIKQEYLGITTGAFFDYQEQITASRGMFLREIIRKQKVLAAVTRNNSHDDWANNKESLNVPAIMLEGLNLPNGCKIPLIFNGGTLNIKMGEDGSTVSLKLFHQVSGRGTARNPVKPLRDQIISEKIDRNQKTPLVAIAGHNHTRAGVSSERVMAGNNEVQLVLLQNGTAKGLDPKHPDFFLVGKGGLKPQPLGAAVIIRQKTEDDQVQLVPTYGNERSRRLLSAFEILNKTESLGVTEELRRELEQENGPLIIDHEKTPPNSLVVDRIGGQKIDSKLYRQLWWNLEKGRLSLPFGVYTLSHAEMGSSEADLPHIRTIIDEVNKWDQTGLLVLNGMISKDIPGKGTRHQVLDQFTNVIGEVPQSKRVGIMLDSVLRSDRWNQPVKINRYSYGLPIITGDNLYYDSPVAATPLFEGGATIVFNIGYNRFNFYAIDGVGNFGSRQDPYLALVQMDRLSNVQNEVVTGGNSTIPGVLTTPDTLFVANGWNSPVRDPRYGKSSQIRVPKGGQGVIMFPNGSENALIYGGGSLRETRDTFAALTLHQGLSTKGEVSKLMRRSK